MSKLAEIVAAIRRDDAQTVRRILDENPSLAQRPVPRDDQKFHTLLHVAAPGDGCELSEARLNIARMLLDAGLPVDELGEDDNHGTCTALTRAAWGGHVPLVHLLIERGADPNGKSTDHPHSPISTAARHGHAAAVAELVRAGAQHSLIELILAGMAEHVKAMLDREPALVNRPLADHSLPLHLAVSTAAGRTLVPMLLDRDADPNATDRRGRNAMHAAIEADCPDAARQLLAVGGVPDIFAAAGLGDEQLVRKLIAQAPTAAQARQIDGLTPLFYAAWCKSVECVQLLLDAGAEVSPRVARLWACLTPLHVALQRRQRDMTRLLIQRGADLNAFSPNQYFPTPLHAAARWGNVEDIAFLVDHGADLYGGCAWEHRDLGVLGWLRFSGEADKMQLLLDRGMRLDHPRCREALSHLPHEHQALIELLRKHGWSGR